MKVKRKMIITEEVEQGVLAYLAGKITTRQLGETLGYSHQGAINLVSSVCCQWYQEGKLYIS